MKIRHRISIVSTIVLLISSLGHAADPTPLEWSIRMANSEVARRGENTVGGSGRWDYTTGLFTLSLLTLDEKAPDQRYPSEPARKRLEQVGRGRALIYKTFVLTGLRLSELASIEVQNLDLDAEVPYIVLDAADEKNRKGSELPIREDLAQDIGAWLADKLTAT
jgi:integrase